MALPPIEYSIVLACHAQMIRTCGMFRSIRLLHAEACSPALALTEVIRFCITIDHSCFKHDQRSLLYLQEDLHATVALQKMHTRGVMHLWNAPFFATQGLISVLREQHRLSHKLVDANKLWHTALQVWCAMQSIEQHSFMGCMTTGFTSLREDVQICCKGEQMRRHQTSLKGLCYLEWAQRGPKDWSILQGSTPCLMCWGYCIGDLRMISVSA